MNRIFSITVTILSSIAFFIVTDAVNAQVIRRRAVPMQPSETSQPGQGGQFTGQRDMFIVNWIGADNQTEIVLNQFASQRASSQEVKDFAQEMIRSHEALASKLNQTVANTRSAGFPQGMPYTAGYNGQQATAPATPGTVPVASGANPAPPATEPSAGQSSPATGTPGAAASAPGTAIPTPGAAAPVPSAAATAPGAPSQVGATVATTGPAGNQLGGSVTIQGGPNSWSADVQRVGPVNFKREINEQLVSIIEQKLGQKKGQEFDRCFVQGQIAGHLHMLATLEVARNQASPQLKPVLDEAVSVAEKHLSHAESLLSKIEPREAR